MIVVSSNDRRDSPLCAEICKELRSFRNADGGWPYQPGKRSRIEPTCWALLALSQFEGQPLESEVLLRWPRRDNWLIDVSGAPANHTFNAIAAMTLLQSASTETAAERLVRLLIASKGLSLPPDSRVRVDSRLQGWSWVDGTFSWVEPTAWSMLLLKQRLARGPYPDAAERVRVGEQVLNDRACRGGGWNYGNSSVFGQDLVPYVTTTALALLALQDRPAENMVVEGLRRLQADVVTERSAVGLSLGIVCLRVHQLPTDVPRQILSELIVGRATHQRSDLLGLAMALAALSEVPLTPFLLSRA